MNKDLKFTYTVNLCYLINKRGEVLLQYKSRGFGKGKWNGPGGKKEQDETIEKSAVREVKEETDVTMKNIQKMGELEFVFTENKEENNYTHVFVCRDWEGEPKNMGEGELKWFKIKDIPLDKMWDDDKYWLKDLLKGEYQHKRFYFDENYSLVNYEKI